MMIHSFEENGSNYQYSYYGLATSIIAGIPTDLLTLSALIFQCSGILPGPMLVAQRFDGASHFWRYRRGWLAGIQNRDLDIWS